VTIHRARGTLARCAIPFIAALILPGCIAVVAVMRNMDDPKGDFEGNADGRLYSDYVESCYWRGQLEPSKSMCGRLMDTRDAPETVEYVHGLHNECVYSFVVEKKTRLITSWRYISSPGNCWTRAPQTDGGTPLARRLAYTLVQTGTAALPARADFYRSGADA